MNFNPHYNLVGKHAFLSASQHSWVNYSDDKLAERLVTSLAAQRGTEMHALASDLIRLKVKLPRNKTTFNSYASNVITQKHSMKLNALNQKRNEMLICFNKKRG